MEAQGRAAWVPSARRPVFGTIEPDHQAFEPAPREAHAEQGEAVEKGVDGALWHRFEYDTEQAGRAGKVPLPDGMAGRAGEGRVEYTPDFRTLAQPAGDNERCLLVALETDPHGAQAAQRQVDVVGADAQPHRADRFAELRPRGRASRDCAQHHVRMADDVLGASLHRHVDALLEGAK